MKKPVKIQRGKAWAFLLGTMAGFQVAIEDESPMTSSLVMLVFILAVICAAVLIYRGASVGRLV